MPATVTGFDLIAGDADCVLFRTGILVPCDLAPCVLVLCDLVPCDLAPCDLLPCDLLPCDLLLCDLLPCVLIGALGFSASCSDLGLSLCLGI